MAQVAEVTSRGSVLIWRMVDSCSGVGQVLNRAEIHGKGKKMRMLGNLAGSLGSVFIPRVDLHILLPSPGPNLHL